jgi:hypothetical protein
MIEPDLPGSYVFSGAGLLVYRKHDGSLCLTSSAATGLHHPALGRIPTADICEA